jgi:monoamine oxidase
VVDVVVVGGGYAGLAAARAVVGAGRSVALLEARERVGGRIQSIPGPGDVVYDVGGQWIGPTQDRMAALAREYGVGTFKTYNDGDNVYLRAGLRQRYATSGPLGPIPPEAPGAAEAGAAIVNLNDMAQKVPRDAPWTAAQAREWDSQNFEAFKNANAASEGGRFLLDVGIEAVFAQEPRDISLLYVLFYIGAAGNEDTPGDFNRLLNTGGGAQESRFVGGAQTVARAIASKLGSRVVLGAPVRRIEQRGGTVTVHADGIDVVAHRAIVAMAPPLTARIAYDPPLPGMRDQLTQRFPNGSVIKVQVLYDTPFWRADGLTGQAVGDADPVRITFDNSPPDGSPGVLLGFIEGELARQWSQRSAAERRAAAIESFAAYFGPQARQVRDYVERDWSGEVWTRGCYGGSTPPGVLLDYGPHLRRPVDRIHWAGTETSTIWAGYMEGAVRSGERAAREVLALLPGGSPSTSHPARRRSDRRLTRHEHTRRRR